MRHGRKVNHLSRKTAHRKAMLANMACSLILHKRITTTVAKAKALRVYVEPILTKSKVDSTHSRRLIFGELQSKETIGILFKDVAAKIADRPGGYTRILKTGNRLGDNAEMCFIELVDFNENMLGDVGAKKAKSTRRRGGKKKSASKDVAEVETLEATATTDEAVAEAKPAKIKKEKAKPKNDFTEEKTESE